MSVGDDIAYTVVVDAAPGPDINTQDLSISYAADPTLTGLREDSSTLVIGTDNTLITIEVE